MSAIGDEDERVENLVTEKIHGAGGTGSTSAARCGLARRVSCALSSSGSVSAGLFFFAGYNNTSAARATTMTTATAMVAFSGKPCGCSTETGCGGVGSGGFLGSSLSRSGGWDDGFAGGAVCWVGVSATVGFGCVTGVVCVVGAGGSGVRDFGCGAAGRAGC